MLCSVQACAVSIAKQVHTSPMPELWNMTKCICMASALAIVGIAASVLMLVRNLTSSFHCTLLAVPTLMDSIRIRGSGSEMAASPHLATWSLAKHGLQLADTAVNV